MDENYKETSAKMASNTAEIRIQKFPDWVDKEIYAYNKHSLKSNRKGYGGKTH
jgi:hypothetical protein